MGCLFSSEKVSRLEREKENLVNEIESLERKVEKCSRDAMLHSESILRKSKGEDGGEALTGSIGAKLSFKKYFEVLCRNLKELETIIKKITEENSNLNSNITIKDTEITEFKKQSTYFHDTFVKVLEQLGQYRIGCFSFIEGEPKSYPVAFSNGIKNLVDELNKNKKENIDLLQYKTKQGNELTNLQNQIKNLQQSNSKLQNQNQQLQTALEEARLTEQLSNSRFQRENEFNQSKRAAVVKQEQCDTSEEILHLLSKISEYEEQLKTRDIFAINKKLQELNKSLEKQLGNEMHGLNLGILKLLRTLKDDQLNKQDEEFKRAMNLKIEAFKKEQGRFYLLNPEDLRKKFKDHLSENVRGVEDELKTFQQIILDFPSIEAERRAAYEGIVSDLTNEYTHLQKLSSSEHSSPKTESVVSFDLPENHIALKNPYVREALTRLVEINKSTRELEKGVNKFRGRKTDKIFLDLEHKLVDNMTYVDKIQVNGYEVVSEKRREAVKYVQECLNKLINNVINI